MSERVERPIPVGPPTPSDVSVVIASYNSSATIEACLGSLGRQSCSGFEVIVVDSSEDGAAEIVARDFPDVRLFAFAERKYPGDARNVGVRNARGRIIAFVDADCVADPDWVREIVAAHAAPDLVIGGAVGNANPESYFGWGVYFAELSQWMPGTPRRRMVDIPTCCLSVKRQAFDAYGPFLEGTYCSDTAFNWRAREGGHEPLFVPSIRVSHTNLSRLRRIVSKFVMHGRAYARVRGSERALSLPHTAMLAAGAPAVLPLLLYSRILVRVLRSRANAGRFLFTTPAVLAVLFAWSYGEFAGYVEALASARRLGSKTPGLSRQ